MDGILTEQERQSEISKLIREQRKDDNSHYQLKYGREIPYDPAYLAEMEDRGLIYNGYHGFTGEDV